MRDLRTALGVLLILGLSTVDAAPADQPQPGKQTEGEFQGRITITVRLRYLLYLPPQYKPDGEPWPLLVFLHGMGEVGNNLELVKRHGPPKLISQGKHFPFIVLSPQSPRPGWNVHAVAALIDHIADKYNVDRTRIYLTGLSMGGFGTWALAAAYPEKFAAIAPICGGGDPRTAERLKDIPVWVFHGAKDRVVPLRASQRMVEAIKAAGGTVKFTVYPDAGHDSWTVTYENPELYKWFLQHRKKPRVQSRATNARDNGAVDRELHRRGLITAAARPALNYGRAISRARTNRFVKLARHTAATSSTSCRSSNSALIPSITAASTLERLVS